MPKYAYKAKKGPSEAIEGSLVAESEKEAIEKISAMGYLPVHLREEADSGAIEQSGLTPSGQDSFRIPSRVITLCTRQLASLLKAGVPILRALSIISEQSDNPRLKAVLSHIHRAVKEGAPFSAVLSRYPSVFPPLYVAMVRTGEDSGALSEVLFRISEYRRTQEEMFSRFRMAMVYPCLMALVGLSTIVFMLTFVMPRLAGIYTTMGQRLPLPTRILLSVSSFFQHWFVPVIFGAAVLVLIIWRQSRTPAGKAAFGRFMLGLPLFGPLISKAELGRFCRTLELLLHSGLPILRALTITVPVLENDVIKQHLSRSYKDLEQGGSFSSSLKASRLIPSFMSNLISVGEESGRIDDALKEVADSYERDTDDALRVATNLLEPVLILGMGLIVGFMVMAMLLPIFEINYMFT
ncbi:MAG TPA: type II secretion system F family protein [Candidatus Omnitrophota bacterium]|nr:type II secretion system F family protein [Candidatus Omnitrophota bacterium]